MDYKPLYVKGARVALFKVRLLLYRYTLVAKGIVNLILATSSINSASTIMFVLSKGNSSLSVLDPLY
jgi:hypothetical protein